MKNILSIKKKMKNNRSVVNKKHLTAKNRVRYIRNKTKPKLNYSFNFSKKSILSRINQDPYYFCPIY